MAAAGIYNLEKRQREERTATMQVCISSYEKRVVRGWITFLLDKREIPFCGLDQMCLIVEEYLDEHPVFEERMEYRYLDEKDLDSGWLNGDAAEEIIAVSDTDDAETTTKFTIRIFGRSNRSLQGELRVENKRRCFRSGMELMRMVHQWLGMQCEASGRQSGMLNPKICSL